MENDARGDLSLNQYAIIGDGQTAALVARDGSIDWFCYDRFDGPAVFCRLLDAKKGGFLQVRPATKFRSTHHYAGDTNVLVTEFECARGRMRLTDCMALQHGAAPPLLLRKVEGLAGELQVRVDFAPTFDFARSQSTVELTREGCRAYDDLAENALILSFPAQMELTKHGATGCFRLRAGQTHWVILAHGARPVDDTAAEKLLTFTLDSWSRWSAHGHYPEPYSQLLRRSALVLKLLIHQPTGAMVAAPTTSLPETPGGHRNWDYRYTWLRDASWVVSALMDLGYHDESMEFIGWLESLDLEGRTSSVFFDLDGHVPGDEQQLRHLRGYRGSRPIRIGNAAANQDQHDVFGEVITAIHMCSEGMESMRPLRPGLWRLTTVLANKAASHWAHADHGLWEVRGQRRHFLSSRLFSWQALDRALRMAQRDSLKGPLAKWQSERTRIREGILSGFDADVGAFTRALGEPELDASALLLPHAGLLPATDVRFVRTVALIRERLAAGKGLLRRYVATDGLPVSQAAFIPCSFWLVECLARQGKIEEAHTVFEQVTANASDLELLSEDIHPGTGELLGNYPQAFSHLTLIRAALAIAEAEKQRRAS